MGKWREISMQVVSEVLEKTKGQSESEIRKALREAYPFGQRSLHPYKVWVSEIKRQGKGKFSKKKPEPHRPLWDQSKGGA